MESTMRCVGCGATFPPDARYCPACGRPRGGVPAPNTGQLPPNHLLHHRYTIIRTIARGGQSAVYLARDTLQNGANRAIKELSDSGLAAEQRQQAVNGFMREADILYRLHHPALTQVFEIFVEDGKHYLVMEFVPGRTLEEELLSKGEPLDWPRVAAWGIAICDVLEYLHSQSPAVIYRDLKPPNVMATPDGGIKLIDFGIARWFHTAQTHDTTQLGTDGYAAMEQYAGLSEPRSDLYALGASLYHLLTGRVPTSAPQRAAGQALPPISTFNPDVPEAAERILGQAMRLDPSDRFPSAKFFRNALVAALQSRAQLSGQLRSATGERPTGQPALLGPRLVVRPVRLDGGAIEMYAPLAFRVEVSNRGGGELSGNAEMSVAWARVEPEHITPETASLDVRIETARLVPGPYRCHVAIRTNGGDAMVPIRFVVRMPELPTI